MIDRYEITGAPLESVFEALGRKQVRILAPRRLESRVELGPVRSFSEVALDAVQTAASAKGLVFPKVERILEFRTCGRDVTVTDPKPELPPTVLFGTRPCEARVFGALDAVFNWDSRDNLVNARMEKLTVVSVACTQTDASCFCSSLGSGPDDARGSDVLLAPLSGGGYCAEVCTVKGEAWLALAEGRVAPLRADARPVPVASIDSPFDAGGLQAQLAKLWDAPLWTEQSLRCLGCGACAFVCPACACFDIQDESDASGGRRLRLWDSCGLRLFTLHASGHNPRELQGQRWRQRIYHKSAYYPQRLNTLGCVGCGKCSRACPIDMNLKEHLSEVAKVS